MSAPDYELVGASPTPDGAQDKQGTESVRTSNLVLTQGLKQELRQRKNLDEESGLPTISYKTHIKVKDNTYIKTRIEETGMVDGSVDPLTYDITEEANEKVKFHVFEFCEDFFVNLFYPFSILYILPFHGYLGLQVRGMAPPTELPTSKANTANGKKEDGTKSTELDGTAVDEGDVNTVFTDTQKPKYNLSAFHMFLTYFIPHTLFKWSWIFVYVATASENGSGASRVPMYVFFMSLLTNIFMNLNMANKKAYRKKAAADRLLLHKERRLEELFFGWLPMPWQLAAFELRVAALKNGHFDLNRKRFTFVSCTELQLREAIGVKVLSYLESDGNCVTSKAAPTLVHGEKAQAAQCTAMAMLLRIALDESFANPAFGPDAENLYINVMMSKKWMAYVLFLMALPFIVAHGIQDGGTYSNTAIVSTFISLLMVLSTTGVPPQGFTFSAILSIKRRTGMLSFMNSLLLPDHYQSHCYDDDTVDRVSSWSVEKWGYALDLSCAANISLWKKCRDVVLEYGSGYRCRTDANGAIMIIYVVVFTLVLVLISILAPGKVSFRDFAFPILLHICLLIPMSLFALLLAFEGEKCSQVADKSASILASAMIHLEELISRQKTLMTDLEFQSVTSARCAASQLQTSLEATKLLHPTEILDLITLDRALVLSVLFAVFTQFTLILDALKL